MDTENTTVNKGGAPIGNKNAAKGSQLSALLHAALNANDRQRMRDGVEKIADAFATGEKWAVEFVFDRFEGKAVAKQEISGPDGADIQLSIPIEFVKTTSTVS